MTKLIFAILISVALVLVIVIGAISAISSSNGEPVTPGNVLDGVLGNNTKDTSAAPVTTVAPGTTAAPAYESPITYLKDSRWVGLDYNVGYEPEYTQSNELIGYIVYVEFKLPDPSRIYNLAFDCTSLASENGDRGTLYWDVSDKCWKDSVVTYSYTEDSNGDGIMDGGLTAFARPTLSGACTVKSGENCYIKFCPVYNYASSQFRTATAASEFAESLKDGNFIIKITDALLAG